MPYYKDEFLVINSRYFKEKNVTVIALSKKFGKRDIIIRGIRNIKSRFRGASEPLTLCSGIVHYKNNIEYYTLSSVEIEDYFYSMDDLLHINEIFFMLGLINYFLPYNMLIHNFFESTITFLKKYKETNNHCIAFLYALWLLKKVGYQPNFENCTNCGTILNSTFKIDDLSHSIICAKCFNSYNTVFYPAKLLVFLKNFYSGNSVNISGILQNDFPEYELRKFLKNYLTILIDYNKSKKILDFL